jgi:recombination protein RecA
MDWIEKIYKTIGENDSNQDVKDWLTTGYLPLNHAMSGRYDGGLPVGRITEIFGAESCGKTLLATMAMIETQRRGGLAMLLDYEHAFSISRAKSLGMSDDREKWIYKQPETAEKGFQILEFVANEVRRQDSERHVTVVVDSVASMVTEADLKAGYEDVNMKSRLSLPVVMSDALKKLAALVNNTNVTLIFLNQTRANVGVLFGDKEKTTGGNALKFYASLRVKLSKIGKIKDDDGAIVGERVVAQVVKNKVFEPFRQCEYEGNFREGVNLYGSHINALQEMGLLGDKKGYVVVDGTSYRRKELEEKSRHDPALYARLLTLFEGATPPAMEEDEP